MRVYLCGGGFEEILCGVYDAWADPAGRGQTRLALARQEFQPSFFEEYIRSVYEEEKFRKVFCSIQDKLSGQILDWVYRASLSSDPERPDKIYRFLIEGFRRGPGVADQLQLPPVHEIFKLCRFVGNESHRMTEFLRFSQTPWGFLLGRMGPENDVLPLISGHFADRMPDESWLIWDKNRKKASVHPAGREWYLRQLSEEENQRLEALSEGGEDGLDELAGTAGDGEDYEELWKTFCHSIAIMERKNPRCQMTHLPLRYRPYMTEFR